MNEIEQRFSKIHKKTPLLEPHFNNEPAALLKRDFNTGFSSKFC